MLKQARAYFIETLFPRFCVGCAREGVLWCHSCAQGWVLQSMNAQCPFCKTPGSDRVCGVCRPEVYLDGVSALLPYGNPVVRKALQVWKYDRDREIESVIEQWMIAGAEQMAPPPAPFYTCPVPLHEGRARYRGFDQAERVASWASELYGIPASRLLTRQKRTASQAQRSGSQRQVGEMDGVFQVTTPLVPEHVLLCDDVFTSGATMDAAARVLKEAGVKQVWGWVIAKGN